MAVVEVVPEAFVYVDFDAARIAALADDVATRIALPADFALRIEVDDADDRSLPAVAPAPGPAAESGRGLLLVDELATRWGADPIPGGKRVWFEVVG